MKWEKWSLRMPACVLGMQSSRAFRITFSRSVPFRPLARAISIMFSTAARAGKDFGSGSALVNAEWETGRRRAIHRSRSYAYSSNSVTDSFSDGGTPYIERHEILALPLAASTPTFRLT